MVEQLLPWQQAAWSHLQSTINQDRVPQALLLAGPPGIGKRVLAQYYAAEILCYNRSITEGRCHTCNSCQLMREDNHIDCIFVEAESDAQAISIEQVRSMSARIYQSPAVARHKVAIMIDADKMQEKAANALLKTLEEPPANTTILLLAAKPVQLPATIKSRCQVVTINSPDIALLTTHIQQSQSVSAVDVQRAYAYAMGSPSATAALIKEGQYQAVIDMVIHVYVLRQVNIERLLSSLKTTSIEQLLHLSTRLVSDLIGYRLLGASYAAILLSYQEASASSALDCDIYRLYALYDQHLALFAEYASGIVWQSNAILLSLQHEWEQTLGA